MPFSPVLSFLLSTHSVDCAVPLLLSIHLVNSALFLQFTAQIVRALLTVHIILVARIFVVPNYVCLVGQLI